MQSDRPSFLAKRFVKNSAVVSRVVLGEMMFVPMHETAGRINKIFTTNEVGARIWSLVDGQNTVADIAKAITTDFEVSADRAEQDVQGFLEQLLAIEAIRES